MNSPIRIMIDMETPATGARAGILTLGACTFGLPFGIERATFYERASLASNEQLKRTISKETMEWWNTKDPEMRAEAFGGTQAVDDLLDHFRLWALNLCKPGDNLESIELWSRGAGFDCEILQDAFLSIFGSYPFDFRKHMCQRTVERLMPENLKNLAAMGLDKRKHHALADAMNQANVMDIALRNLSWTGGM